MKLKNNFQNFMRKSMIISYKNLIEIKICSFFYLFLDSLNSHKYFHNYKMKLFY